MQRKVLYMPKTKVYEPEFKKKIVQLYLEQGRTIKSLNEEFQLGDGTVRKWVRAFREECETDPDLNDTKKLYEENRRLHRELEEKKKEIAFLKKAAAFFANTIQVMDGADFPEIFKPLASNMGKALDELRTRTDVKWTYISPAGDFQADGAKTGKYILGGEELTLNSKGESVISYADYAVAMVDEALNGNHVQQRISVVAE